MISDHKLYYNLTVAISIDCDCSYLKLPYAYRGSWHSPPMRLEPEDKLLTCPNQDDRRVIQKLSLYEAHAINGSHCYMTTVHGQCPLISDENEQTIKSLGGISSAQY
jgi:hypothetical protein